MKVNGKVVVVTGAASGMGRELALQLLVRGARVAAVDRDAAGLAETAALADAPSQLVGFELDVTDTPSLPTLVGRVVAHFGAVDGLINNAGIIQPMVAFEDLEPATAERVMAVNFFGAVNLTRAFLPHLLARPEAHVVNVSSMGSFLPVPGQTIYGASKAAVKSFSEGLWAELAGTTVRVTVVMPGTVDTNILAGSGLGSYEEQRERLGTAGAAWLPAVMSAERAARIILDGVERDAFRLLVGRDARLLDLLIRLAPATAARLLVRQLRTFLPPQRAVPER